MKDIMQYLGAKSNPLRGRGWEQAAKAFIDRYPLGSDISDEQFDAFWIEWDAKYEPRKRGLYAEHLRKAGTNSKMRDSDCPAFTVDSNHNHRWKVRSPDMAITERVVLIELDRHLANVNTKLRYFGEGTSLDKSPFEIEVLRMRYKTQVRAVKRYKLQLLDLQEELAELNADADALLSLRSLPSGQE